MGERIPGKELAAYRERFTSPSPFELGPDPYDALRLLDHIDALEEELHNERSTFKKRFRKEHRSIILERDISLGFNGLLLARAEKAEKALALERGEHPAVYGREEATAMLKRYVERAEQAEADLQIVVGALETIVSEGTIEGTVPDGRGDGFDAVIIAYSPEAEIARQVLPTIKTGERDG